MRAMTWPYIHPLTDVPGRNTAITAKRREMVDRK
jgi:hypothetical protein